MSAKCQKRTSCPRVRFGPLGALGEALRNADRRCVMSNASARSKSEPFAGSAPRASSCRTKSSNRSEANASRKVRSLPKNVSRCDRLRAPADSSGEPTDLHAIDGTESLAPTDRKRSNIRRSGRDVASVVSQTRDLEMVFPWEDGPAPLLALGDGPPSGGASRNVGFGSKADSQLESTRCPLRANSSRLTPRHSARWVVHRALAFTPVARRTSHRETTAGEARRLHRACDHAAAHSIGAA